MVFCYTVDYLVVDAQRYQALDNELLVPCSAILRIWFCRHPPWLPQLRRWQLVEALRKMSPHLGHGFGW